MFVSCAGVGTGARVATRRGEMAIEALAPGTPLLGLRSHGFAVVQRVFSQPADESCVIILADAFGPGRPSRDVTVGSATPLLLGHGARGVMIPARALVTGATVRSIRSSGDEVWNVVLEDPLEPDLDGEAILVEGLAVGVAGALPEVESGPMLAAARRRVIEQADRLGWHLVADPGLHVMVGRQRLYPAAQRGNTYVFDLPGEGEAVGLRSTSISRATIDAASDDRRRLGVALERVSLDGHGIDLMDPRMGHGLHALEGDVRSHHDGRCWRWTDGEAHIRVGRALQLEVTVCDVMPRWAEPAVETATPSGVAMTADCFVQG